MALERSTRSTMPAPPLESPHSSLDAAFEHQRCRRFEEAERLYRDVIAAHPQDPQAYYFLGLVLQQTGRWHEALECMVAATAMRQDEPAYHFGLGLVLADLGEANAAAVCMQKATQLAPNFGDAHENLGLIWEAMGFEEQAERCFLRALAAQPDLQISLGRLARINMCRGEIAEAVEYCRRWIAVAPHKAEPHHLLGRALDHVGCAPDAWACYRKALSLDPALAGAQEALERSFRIYGTVAPLDYDEDEDDAPRLLN